MVRARVRKDNSEMLDQIADGVKIKRKRKPKAPPAPPELEIIPPDDSIDRWLVLGLDPSLSRTGYAFMVVEREGDGSISARWLDVGSLKPEDASVPVWIRSKAIALTLKELLGNAVSSLAKSEYHLESLQRTGLIISLEAPTPGNDFLTSISRILHLVLLDQSSWIEDFGRIQVQMTNASTLRSLMGLKKTGNKNKTENVAKAYEYLDKGKYHNLDNDACDAVLMAMMGRYSAALLMGCPWNVPERFLIALCNATVEVVGAGRNQRTRIKGILHRPEYWTRYER